jgi:hypothetical protein
MLHAQARQSTGGRPIHTPVSSAVWAQTDSGHSLLLFLLVVVVPHTHLTHSYYLFEYCRPRIQISTHPCLPALSWLIFVITSETFMPASSAM